MVQAQTSALQSIYIDTFGCPHDSGLRNVRKATFVNLRISLLTLLPLPPGFLLHFSDLALCSFLIRSVALRLRDPGPLGGRGAMAAPVCRLIADAGIVGSIDENGEADADALREGRDDPFNLECAAALGLYRLRSRFR